MPGLLMPLIAGICGVVVMTLFLRRARFFHLPETQMVRAIGSLVTKKVEGSLLPGTLIHCSAGLVFAYCYYFFLTTAPDPGDSWQIIVIVCTMIGLVHGLIVTLFLVITVAQYHPIDEFRALTPGDMAAHVIAHIAYGATVGWVLVWPKFWPWLSHLF